MSIHDRFELQRWTAEFPLKRLRAQAQEFVLKRQLEQPTEYPSKADVDRHVRLMEPGGEIVVGPESLAINEQLRMEAFVGGRYGGERLPVDVFVWALGEPPNPAMTKIGGVPYRPRSADWPHDSAGKPLRFIAQLCFADSADISGQLPGDVLLIFGDEDALVVEPNRLAFEWQSLGIKDLTLEVPQIAQKEALTAYYGVIHRTEDWPSAEARFDGRYGRPWLLGVFEGTKIAGHPRFIQGEPTSIGRFLAAVGSISHGSSVYPLINEASPRSWSRSDLMIGDVGSLYLFIDEQGNIQADSQCY